MRPDRYLPNLLIKTSALKDALVTGRDTEVWIDGNLWPTFAYRIEGTVEGIQKVVLEFSARVTIEREDRE